MVLYICWKIVVTLPKMVAYKRAVEEQKEEFVLEYQENCVSYVYISFIYILNAVGFFYYYAQTMWNEKVRSLSKAFMNGRC